MATTLPSKKPQTVKERILAILSNDYPLDVQELRQYLHKDYGENPTYQAVHKALRELMEEEIVTKEQKKYLLNRYWLTEMTTFTRNALDNYTRKKRYTLNTFKKMQKDGDIALLEFSTLTEMDRYFLEVMEHFIDVLHKDEKIVFHYKHCWWPVVHSLKVEELTRDNSRFYCICGSDTHLDRWCVDFENQMGMNVKIDISFAQNSDVQIFGDFLIQVHFDTKLQKRMDAFFKATRSREDVVLKDLITILNMPTKIKVTLQKSAQLSSSLMEETLRRF